MNVTFLLVAKCRIRAVQVSSSLINKTTHASFFIAIKKASVRSHVNLWQSDSNYYVTGSNSTSGATDIHVVYPVYIA